VDSDAEQILTFWIDEVGRSNWYKTDEKIDREVAERFDKLWAEAAEGRLDRWSVEPRGALALLILLDQFPRNMFRGTARAYASDAHALTVAKAAIKRGHDLKIAEPERQFFYLPLMHSECLADQDRCIRLILLNMPETGALNLEHARKHRDVIRRFGRFPSRNAALGRDDGEAEIAYREAGGYMS
jgi:uncharacterized protein (DUF924 family)